MKNTPATRGSAAAPLERPAATARRLAAASLSPNTRRAYAGALHRLLPETTANWGDGKTAAPPTDFQAQHDAADPRTSRPSCWTARSPLAVLAALGIHGSLLDPKATAGALKEARRHAQVDLVEPLAALTARAASDALDEIFANPTVRIIGLPRLLRDERLSADE